MRTILAFLKTRADCVIFGLTTPLTGWQGDDRCGRIRVYNELAASVCEEMGVAVDDLYAVAERHLDQQTDGCHFSAKGYAALADAVAKSIEGRLSQKQMTYWRYLAGWLDWDVRVYGISGHAWSHIPGQPAEDWPNTAGLPPEARQIMIY